MGQNHFARTLSGLAIGLAAQFTGAATVFAQSVQNMPVQGGSGGANFVARCPTGAPLNGIELTSGAWVNSIAGKCLQFKVVPARSMLINTQMVGASVGAKRQDARCGTGQALAGIKYGFTRDGNKPKYVDYVQLICRQNGSQQTVLAGCLDSGNGCWDRHPDPGRYNGFGLAFESRCLQGQVAVGLVGRAGSYIDALAMQCSPDMTPRPSTPVGCGTGNGSCPSPGNPNPNPNKCCSIPYSDPTTGGIGVTYTCGPVCK